MKDTNKLTESFFKVAKTKESPNSIGRTRTRRAVEKDVQDARTAHGKHSQNLTKMREAHKKLTEEISNCEKEVSDARTSLKYNRDILDTMDIADCSGVKHMSDDDIAYIKGGKLFRIEERDGEMHLVPYKKKYNKKNKEEEVAEAEDDATSEESNDVSDADDVNYSNDQNEIDNFIRSLM